MRYTLLDLVQSILASMDGDEVNGINDTTESQSVASIARTTYYDIASTSNATRHFKVFQLNPSLDTTRPVTMTLPSDVTSLSWIKYDAATVQNPEMTMAEVRPMPLHDFLTMVLSLNSTDADVFSYTQVIDGSPFKLLGKNNVRPSYYTALDDGTLIFDSYDKAKEDTLQASKTLCFGEKEYPFVMSNTFVPDLDEKQHQLWLNETKAMCFAELKQVAHPKAEKNSREIKINQQSHKTKVPLQTALQRTPNFGR